MSDIPEADKLKALAGEIRQHTLDHLDHYLQQMQQAITAGGGHFQIASTAKNARHAIADVLAREKCKTARAEPTRLCDEISYFTSKRVDSEALITGANFAVAETGQVCICRDSLPAARPRVVICVLGIESIVPRLSDLAVMLKLLSRSTNGRPMTVSTEILGPTPALRLIFVDNGRRRILAGPHRSALRCIGCGACAAVCPVYQTLRQTSDVGRAGPIAAVMSPLMKGLAAFDQLPFASTLCGACSAVCPVGIDLPRHLSLLRQEIVAEGRTGWMDRFRHRRRTRVLVSVKRFQMSKSTGTILGVPTDVFAPAPKSFREMWKERNH